MHRLRLKARVRQGLGTCRIALCGQLLFHRSVAVGESFTVIATVPRAMAVTSLFCCVLTEDEENTMLRMRYCGIRGAFDCYKCELGLRRAGLIFYSFFAESAHGRLYGYRDAASAEGIAFSDRGEGAHFQLTVTDFAYPPPQWLFGGIIYHIFVDRFSRGGIVPVREDAILRTDWDGGTPQYPAYRGAHLENNEFFGGTLFGITRHIDRLVRLGVNCIYLSPIAEAYSNHKYDTGDYLRIDPMFGGERALRGLLRAASERGVRVVLDGVFNHTGADSVYFNKWGRYPSVGAYQSPESPYYDWYSFYEYPKKYECWWGIDTLPRLNSDLPAVRSFIAGSHGVVEWYARLGIGGFRLDVVDELSDEMISDIKARLSESVGDSVLYGEVWEDASHKIAYGVRKHYYEGRELDGVMNYPLREGLIAFLRYGRIEGLRMALCEVLANMPKRIADSTMNLLGSHDTERIITALAGEEEHGQPMEELATARLSRCERRRGRQLVGLAYLALATLPGIPTVFYGDEVGLEGYRDPLNRRPYPWHRQDKALLSVYRRIGAMRRSQSVYRQGDFSLIALTSELLVFSRKQGDRIFLTVINRGERGVRLIFTGVAEAIFGGSGQGHRHFVYPCSGAVFSVLAGGRFSIFADNGEQIFSKMQTKL